RPTLVIVGGPPGAGKTTVAAGLAEKLGWAVIRSDQVRREVVGADPWGGSPEWLSAPFSSAVTQGTYAAMVRRASVLLGTGESLILDATWATEPPPALAATAAAETGSAFVALHCRAPLAVAERRVARRIAAGAAISTATVNIVRRLAGSFAPWPSAQPIDSAAAIAETLTQALSAVRGATTATPRPSEHTARPRPASAATSRSSSRIEFQCPPFALSSATITSSCG
ncbi:MAG: AAA family ATPase, partial [Candidatus Dormibacter sp.]